MNMNMNMANLSSSSSSVGSGIIFCEGRCTCSGGGGGRRRRRGHRATSSSIILQSRTIMTQQLVTTTFLLFMIMIASSSSSSTGVGVGAASSSTIPFEATFTNFRPGRFIGPQFFATPLQAWMIGHHNKGLQVIGDSSFNRGQTMYLHLLSHQIEQPKFHKHSHDETTTTDDKKSPQPFDLMMETEFSFMETGLKPGETFVGFRYVVLLCVQQKSKI